MSTLSNYSLLQEFHSRPTIVPLPLFNSAVDSVYRDANAKLLNLASKSVQDRRRKRAISNSNNSASSPSSTSPAYSRYLFLDSNKASQVYSEVMMNNDNTPRATWTPSFPSQGAPVLTSGMKRTQLAKKRASRQRPVSRNGPLTSPTKPLSPMSPEADVSRKHRSKVLTQALRKSKEMRGFNKSVDLKLVNPFPFKTTNHIAEEDQDDEDWAAFITSGYGEFPLPSEDVVPPATGSNTATTGRSDSTFMSTSTSATSFASSDLRKTGIDWLDGEMGWASSDEERLSEDEEIVRSPKDTTSSKRFSQTSEVFCTPKSSPSIGFSPRTNISKKKNRSSIVMFKEVPSMKVERRPVKETTTHKQDTKESENLENARACVLGRSSVSSTTSSSASSSALSRDSSCAYSASTRPSSIASVESSPCTNEAKVSHAIASPESSSVASIRRHSNDKDLPITPPRMTSLYRCVEVKDDQPVEDRPLLGAWLSESARQHTLPKIEIQHDAQDGFEDFDDDDDKSDRRGNDGYLEPRMRYSKSSSDLLNVRHNDSRLPRRSSRKSILANCDAAERRPSFQYQSHDEKLSMIYMNEDRVKSRGTTAKLRSRLAAKMNTLAPSTRRSSNPDVPVTPSSADSGRRSPSDCIFGSAAINAIASDYVSAAAAAAAAAASSASTPTPMSMSWQQQRRRVSSDCSLVAPVTKAGFCFDYDPASPLYLSADSDVSSPTSRVAPPPPSSFWRRNNLKAHEAVGAAEEAVASKFPTLRRRGSFRMWK